MKHRERKIKRANLVGYTWKHGVVLSEHSVGYWNVRCTHCDTIHKYETRSIVREAHTKKCSFYKPHNHKWESIWDGVINRTYGISIDEYNQMVESQNGVCAICGEKDVMGRRLAIDHCHTTGKIRGALCANCNVALGNFKDNITNMQKAIIYLETANAR